MMNHDLLMIIYGALIGTGSSITTILFQSWVERREYERRRKEEQKRKTKDIYLPTSEEVLAIAGKFRIHEQKYVPKENYNSSSPWISGSSYFLLLIVLILLLICGGLIYLTNRIDNPILYFVISVFVTFSISFAIIRLRQTK